MKQFLVKSLWFLLPVLFFFTAVEIYIRNSENAFITKAKYFQKNIEKVEVLVLGSSHNQNGVNPKFFRSKTANLSYGSQDIQIDSALFFSNVKQMKNLKKVVFELDYHRLDIENEPAFYRFPWYYMYYGIEVQPVKFINKISLYSSNVDFFNTIILDQFSSNYKPQVINEFGFVEANYSNDFLDFKYDANQIEATAKERLKSRHKELSAENFNRNAGRIQSMIAYCKANKIELYFFSSPLYKTYIENKIPQKDQKVKNYIQKLITDEKINYYNFENTSRFVLYDFSNDDHLNAKGAEKYSKLIDSIIHQ
ncbi:hypothetical protein [Flavobacterium sp.]|uniref:hypothetical protein n=1 Tax=Flavobacterium sp. TaxID=239 RepID=UPI00263A2E35|nr:hypothetical protein [Flavobacterium sp.]